MKQHIAKKLLTCLAAAALLTGSSPGHVFVNAADSVTFTGITGLPFAGGEPFKGVDVSSVISLENSGVVFRDRNGNPQDLFVTLADAGVNTVRVRIWNDPYEPGTGANYGGGICDTDCAVKIAKRCADAGLKLLVDFHYSDFWADPGKQKAPKAWANYSVDQKADAIYRFTAETLARLGETGADIAMVQVGNETTTGMCGVMLESYNWSDEGWRDLAKLFSAGAKAVREYSADTLVALHFTNPEKASNMSYLAKMLAQTRVDYDVFATSYYPYWHGTLQNLTQVLTGIAQTYGKQVMVAETSWVYTLDDADQFGNTISSRDKMGSYVSYPVSVEGQRAFLHDLFAAVAAVPDGKGIGVFYWEPAWLPVGTDYSRNLELWNTYGSGWGNRAAGAYDKSAGEYFGGSAVDNEALFSVDGIPHDSLYLFSEIHGSGETDVSLGKNLLQNPGFEADGGWSDSPAGWALHPTAGGHFDVRAEDPRTGSYALHWYSETAFSGSTASASVKTGESGTYRCSMHLQGDESAAYTLTVQTSGGKTETVTGKGMGWAVWQEPCAEIEAAAGETVTMTLTVSGGAGSYGSADDCAVRRVTQKEQPPYHFDDRSITLHRKERHCIRTEHDGALTYQSSAPDIAKVDEHGEITAVGRGTAVITVYDRGNEAGHIRVTVEQLSGDLNDDGKADAADAALLMQYLLTKAALTEEQASAADSDGDGMLTAADLTLLKASVLAE